MYKLVIVDDEKPARARLVRAVSSMDAVCVVGEADSGEAAVEAIVELAPEIVLLDIDMPHGDGFFVVKQLVNRGLAPEVIFITAYDRFAIAAFEVGAIDYLLKPTEVSRIQRALERAMRRHEERTAVDRVAALQAAVEAGQVRPPANPVADDLWLKEGGKTIRVPLKSIVSVEADRDYVKVGTQSSFFHVRGTIAEYAKQLEGNGFLRIHRSIIVRVDAVTKLASKGANAYEVELLGEMTMPVGRSYNKTVKRVLVAQK